MQPIPGHPRPPMFTGSMTALVTPFEETGEVDGRALESLVARQLDAGTAGLVVAATTGESAALRPAEFERLLTSVVGQVKGRIPVIAGTGTASTDRTIEQTRLAARLGVDAVLVVTPYYVRPTQDGLIAHFRAVADASDVPVVLYNVPARTAVDLLPGSVAELSDHDRIVGIKEAVGDMDRIDALRAACGDAFTILSGDDPTCLDAMRHGALGVISVAANVVPDRFRELVAAAARGDWSAAESVNRPMQDLYGSLSVETNPIPVKWALQEMGLCSARLRLPLVTLSEPHRARIRATLASLGALPQ